MIEIKKTIGKLNWKLQQKFNIKPLITFLNILFLFVAHDKKTYNYQKNNRDSIQAIKNISIFQVYHPTI